jgi:hypothetical protein
MSNSILGGLPEQGEVVQAFGAVAASRIGLSEAVRIKSVSTLNRLLAHTMAVRDLYKEGTNDLIVSQVVRNNELQSWFVGEQLTAQDERRD